MGRAACTEPQCLYKGDLYLYLYLHILIEVTFKSIIHSFISIQPLERFSRKRNPVRRPVWLWHSEEHNNLTKI